MFRNIEKNNRKASSIELQKKVFSFVNHLLNFQLAASHTFHNWQHTCNVIRGVQEISKNIKLTSEEEEMVLLSAWFHDTGHIKKCVGHEEESKNIAKNFLNKNNYPEEKIKQVLQCIDATKLPQSPNDLLGEILCDSDLYHLSFSNYLEELKCLREEWSLIYKKRYSEKKWLEMNLSFLKKHKYFTKYGQEILEKGKLKNIKLLEKIKAESKYS